jgi:hypothetical protein
MRILVGCSPGTLGGEVRQKKKSPLPSNGICYLKRVRLLQVQAVSAYPEDGEVTTDSAEDSESLATKLSGQEYRRHSRDERTQCFRQPAGPPDFC